MPQSQTNTSHMEEGQPHPVACHMSMRGLGSLSDLAKIIEAANNPESELREDR